MAKNWALVIGINDYNPLNFRPLKYAKPDAERVKAFFEAAGFERVFFFSDDSPRQTLPNGIEIPTQATYGNLISFLQGFFEHKFLKTGDNFWFFFAGHGERYHDEDYLMPMDANAVGSEVITGLKVNYVRERLCRCGADNVILILDACRSQGSRDGRSLGLEVQPGVITIASCQPNQKSWEVDELQQGVFTYALLEALQLPGEQSCATVERLGHYLNQRVPELCQRYGKAPAQVPRIGADPIEKQHFILIPKYARQADLNELKLDAYRLKDKNPALAEQICIRLNALALGRDLEVIDILTDLRRQTRAVTSAPPEPAKPPVDVTSSRSAPAATTTVSNVVDDNFSPSTSGIADNPPDAAAPSSAFRRTQREAEAQRKRIEETATYAYPSAFRRTQQDTEAHRKRIAEAAAQRQRQQQEAERKQKQDDFYKGGLYHLEREDFDLAIADFQQAVALGHPNAEQKLAEAQRQKQAAQDDLSTEKGIDYTHLRDLLKAGKWRDADDETYKAMIRAVGKQTGDWFTTNELLNFPCTDLRTIDGLWVKYSQGKFGFSVQKKIYVECGTKLDGKYPGDRIWYKFCEHVGWRKDGNYLNYRDFKANPSFSLSGEFPVVCGGGEWRVVFSVVFLFSRTETCKL